MLTHLLDTIISLSIRGSHRRHGRLACSVALSGQDPKPRSGAPKARGFTANACTELSLVWPRCAHDRTLSAESSTSFYTLSARSSRLNDFVLARLFRLR